MSSKINSWEKQKLWSLKYNKTSNQKSNKMRIILRFRVKMINNWWETLSFHKYCRTVVKAWVQYQLQWAITKCNKFTLLTILTTGESHHTCLHLHQCHTLLIPLLVHLITHLIRTCLYVQLLEILHLMDRLITSINERIDSFLLPNKNSLY